MEGTIHMALGNSIPESGGLNQSSIHWNILKDMRKGRDLCRQRTLLQEWEIPAVELDNQRTLLELYDFSQRSSPNYTWKAQALMRNGLTLGSSCS